MDKYSHINIADRIMRKAHEAGIPSERALCLQAGVNPNFVRAIRIGKTRSPRGDSLQKIAYILNVSVDWILTEHGENAPVTNDTGAPSGVTAGQQISARALQKGGLGCKSEQASCLFDEMLSSDRGKDYQILSIRLASLERAIFEIASQGKFHITALSPAESPQADSDLDICRKNMISAMCTAGLNPNSWAKIAGVSESGVRGFLNGDAPNISLGFLSKLAAVLGIRAADFLRSDGIQKHWNRADRPLDK